MIQLIYISSATAWPNEQELNDLLVHARSKNMANNITGILLYNSATYLQVLEGPEEAVDSIFEQIKQDPRNTGIVELAREQIIERDFPNWNMGFKNLDNISPATLPGFIDVFNGKLDIETVSDNKSAALYLLKSFTENT